MMGLIWTATGVGVYLYLGSHRSTLTAKAAKPDAAPAKQGPLQRLPGTLYLVQDGTVYRLQHGTFTPILKAPGGNATWTQPAVTPDGRSLVVVRHDYAYSDLYLVDTAGNVQKQLTHDANNTVELNHWALYPRLSADGNTLYFNYDPKDIYATYNVVLAVWSVPLNGTINSRTMRKWTVPNGYTGGDLQPVPLPAGGVIYTKFGLQTSSGKILGQLWLAPRIGAVGRALTPPEDDCSQPSLSPDGTHLAMMCTSGKQLADIEVATWDGTNLGPRQVVVTGQLAAQPTWAPDGQSLVYVAAEGITGHFQLWQQPLPPPPTPSPAATPLPTKATTQRARTAKPSPTPTPLPTPTPPPLPKPVQLTNNLDFDATSTIAWHA